MIQKFSCKQVYKERDFYHTAEIEIFRMDSISALVQYY